MGNQTLPEIGWIILDTNFLIDFYSNEEIYLNSYDELRKNNKLVSIDLVKCEFIRSKSLEVVNSKINFFTRVVDSCLPYTPEIYKLVQSTIIAYGQDIEKVSVTDIFLAFFIQKYQSTYLLTRNHHDFPTRLFSRKYVFNIELDKDIRTYALYQYRNPKAKEIEAEVSDIPF